MFSRRIFYGPLSYITLSRLLPPKSVQNCRLYQRRANFVLRTRTIRLVILSTHSIFMVDFKFRLFKLMLCINVFIDLEIKFHFHDQNQPKKKYHVSSKLLNFPVDFRFFEHFRSLGTFETPKIMQFNSLALPLMKIFDNR